MNRGHIILIQIAVVLLVTPSFAGELADRYIETSNQMQEMDVVSRQVMGSLYEIDYKMHRISKKRDRFTTELLTIEQRVTSLARSIASLEDHIESQKHKLSRRLRAIYMIGNEGVVRVIFSSASSQDLDQSLKYLRLISEHDLKLIRSYRKNVATYERKRKILDDRVRHLLRVRQLLKAQESILSQSQQSKSMLLKKLSVNRRRALERLAEIRRKAGDPELMNLINLSFFEHKGQLSWPVSAKPAVGYGTIRNPIYHYSLAHKGYDFHLTHSRQVKSIFNGRVVFDGHLPGYNNVIIVDHGDHFYSVYGQLDKPVAKMGESVKQGQVLAVAGHDVYFEIRHFSDAIDPKPWLNKNMRVR